ncbi:nucleoside-diphosphate-sugar epimerase [Bradyrhizobium diazoefficiens]|uniref:dTDP-glucose-4,6 dehydratase n=2 Tax=Bradyrhizobium diazoefficiens TaxID=1355477 RepID=A0A0E4FQ86_9BRAD|nr:MULTISPECIES: SDR family oxidoreductase [Bradyrhizobium]MBP1064406.1 nucleoside-diphosphate-sugar epimerase [Bradyrhizobium japonicum]APO52462.1 UDP-glucose 4-epimerase [Bradyrhizobium diazoefficiens]AWO92245.1 SDR family oxidoreductase [Bradyrhizobium diazoefficiens]KGJ70978.1 putative UDP-glucose 4-epimerase [Bradyrhizobium diazoefficiens SEMIA 5080]KOY08426.1 UDP-glucose 4-epimerase [Bradyrhizobium diazoefficiens]
MIDQKWNVMVTGGAGYVGSVLVPHLLAAGHKVTVLDLFMYGESVFDAVRNNPNLRLIKGDIRDEAAINEALRGNNAVIHLACISNDPSFELDPALGKSINYDCFRPMVRAAKKAGIKRFIYASSSSVYGIKDEAEVTEELSCEPLTDYSKFKAMCETDLADEAASGFVACTVRPATVCGYAPRQRLDVVVNILTNLAVNTGRIRVFGGTQRRPNLHIEDMSAAYLFLLQQDDAKIDGKTYNIGYENHSLMKIADIVKSVVGNNVDIAVEPTDDLRSYHVSSEKIRRELGFAPTHTIEQAVSGLVDAFKAGRLPNSLNDPRYFNIKMMQNISLK